MSGRQWGYLIATTLVAGLGTLVAAGLEGLSWADLTVPNLILGAVLSMAVAVANYFKPSPRQ